jgi:NAD(P)-dependent dehydrogenase (short-subunit alcohol dehydrogenase family)
MDLNLASKSVLITGGSKGLGFAIAQRFASEGCHLYLAARSQAALEDAADAIRRQSPVKVNTTSVWRMPAGRRARKSPHKS